MKKFFSMIFFVIIIYLFITSCSTIEGSWQFDKMSIETNGSILYFTKNQIENLSNSSNSKVEQLVKKKYDEIGSNFIILENNNNAKLKTSTSIKVGTWKNNGEKISIGLKDNWLNFNYEKSLLTYCGEETDDAITYAYIIYYKKIKS